MNLFVRSTMLIVLALTLAGCQGQNTPKRLAGELATRDAQWAASYKTSYAHEPANKRWDSSMEKGAKPRAAIRRNPTSIRQYVSRIAPAGANPTRLSALVSKRKQAKIHCIPKDLTMILNAVSWHYGKRVHIQSGYRSRSHNRRIGGAKRSYHILCKAVDIQVAGVNKYDLAKFLKTLPGRGGVGTYCNISTVHIDVGPKRSWHYGCRKRRPRHYARAKRRR